MSLHLSRAGRVAIAALALAGAAAVTRAVLHVSQGLRAEYFTTIERLGDPSFRRSIRRFPRSRSPHSGATPSPTRSAFAGPDS